MTLLDPDSVTQPSLSAFGDLHTAATLALERGHRVLALANAGQPVFPYDLHCAKAAIIMCSAYLGDARAGLLLSLRWTSGDDRIDDAVQTIAERMRAWGGVVLEQLDVDAQSRLYLLLDAARVLREAQASGDLTREQVQAIASRWREHDSVQRHLEEPDWQPLQQALLELVGK